MTETAVRKRLHHLDWLRVLGMGTVFLFHNARFFDWDYWHVKNAQTSFGAMFFVAMVHQWIMPLFFVLAGAAAHFSLTRRSGKAFVQERLLRLVVPYLFGLVALIPPQVYVELASRGRFGGSYLAFYPRFFTQLRFGWSPQVFGNGYHLWFLGYLFLLSLVCLPLFAWLTHGGDRLRASLGQVADRRGGIFFLALPIAAVQVALRAAFPSYLHWADFFYWLLFFIYGYLIYSDPRLEEGVRRDGPAALAWGVLTWLGFGVLHFFGYVVPWETHPSYSTGYLLYQVLRSFNTWFWLVAILGLGARRLEFANRGLRYAGEAVMPFYVLHQTVILLTGYYVVRWRIGICSKYLVISLTSFLVIMALYELVVRRIPAVRFLFGMRPQACYTKKQGSAKGLVAKGRIKGDSS